MPGIVQHKSAVANGSRATAIATLDAPITIGNLIVVVNGSDPSADTNGPYDGHHTYQALFLPGYGPSAVGLQVSWVIAQFAVSSISTNNSDGDLVSTHIHVYEIAGYNTPDATGTNFQSSTASGTVSSGPTTSAAEFILAVFASDSGSPTFTPGDGLAGEHTTGTDGVTIASGGVEVGSAGVQTETANASASGNITSVVATFSYVAPPPPPPPPLADPPFLGSVRVLGSAPAGRGNPFLGTVIVISSADVPDGLPNPYLGSVVLGTPGATNNNPELGYVVVVTEVPSGRTDVFLGTVEESA